jgi:hypothetical protein
MFCWRRKKPEAFVFRHASADRNEKPGTIKKNWRLFTNPSCFDKPAKTQPDG